jgi:hypothetical protein
MTSWIYRTLEMKAVFSCRNVQIWSPRDAASYSKTEISKVRWLSHDSHKVTPTWWRHQTTFFTTR